MKRMSFPFVLLMLIATIGCGKHAPSPTDSDVKKLTLEISNNIIRDQVLSILAMQNGDAVSQAAFQLQIGFPECKYEKWNAARDKNESIKKLLNDVDDQMEKLDLSLSGIRILSKDDSTRRTSFAAELVASDGKKSPIEATAQYTEDDELHVEVRVLK